MGQGGKLKYSQFCHIKITKAKATLNRRQWQLLRHHLLKRPLLQTPNLIFLERRLEVAIAELDSLPSSRPVYVKNGNIFFRTTTQKAISSEQRKLDLAKSKLQKLNKQ
ncbi:uncharacterized protein LOC130809769 isoform X1 [Amaranthus tricolor]|uniref:uncharacterized protein LOC130809769 isoform X1 n=1 Tax=Amaranthus tricolor TaxID=29722 RepID=UPI002590F751|nr:uncharacterized protein LOC130809769 isoform X1 [Amaranthus tricolor]